MQRSMKTAFLLSLLWTLLSRLTGQHATARVLSCRLKCVVIDDDAGSLEASVPKVWEDLRSSKKVTGLELHFHYVKSQYNFTIDSLIPTYMAIGSPNGSLVVGPYTRAHVMAAAKLPRTFFMTTEPNEDFLLMSGTVSAFPRTRIFSGVVKDLVQKLNWTSVAILYDTNEGLGLIEDLVHMPEIVVRAWKMPANATMPTLKSVLMDIRRVTTTIIIFHKSQALLVRALDLALQFGMLSGQFKWIAPFLDISEFETTAIADFGVTLYTLGLRFKRSVTSEPTTELDYAVLHDTLLVIYHYVKQYHHMTGNCNVENRTGNQYEVLSKIDGVGMTGRLTFDEHGKRKGCEISILSLRSDGFREIGLWNSSMKESGRRLRLHHTTSSKTPSTTDSPFGSEPLRIVSIQEPPFLMNKASRTPGSKTKYEGFCIDLLEELTNHLGLIFEVYLVDDQQYGRKLADGSWNGMVRQILDGKAAMAIAPMAITTSRAEVVNFTDPFCTVAVEAIGRIPTIRSSKFRITDPLAPQVWVALFAIMSAISIILYFYDRLVSSGAPSVVEGVPSSEWRKEAPRCNIWFTLATILIGVTGVVVPRSNAGRLLISVLWIFAVAIISLYTAKMAAIMATSELQTATKQRLEDLLGQREVSYGTVRHSDVSWLFEKSSNPTHVKMWQVMAEHDLPGSVDMFQQSLSDVTDNQDDGFQRVRRSGNRNYHFVWHTPGVRFHAAEDCDLVTMETELGRLSFGIALPPNSPGLGILNQGLKQLREQGVLQKLENKWWGFKGCSTSFHRPYGVSLEDLTGLFIILSVTVVVSTVISILEHNFCRQKIEKKRNRRVPMKHSAVISTCDGVTGSNTVQMEEPFLPLNASAGSGSTTSRQTQIF